MDVALALLAAFFFALGLVLQEKAASAQPDDSVRVGFLARLARNPLWLLGLGAQGVGFVCQAIALGIGRMVIVQPLLIATIVFALPLARIITKRQIQRVEVAGAVIVALGLSALLIATTTSDGTTDASIRRWLVVGGICVGIAVVLFLVAIRRRPSYRAALLGSAAGILFGLAAALTKSTVVRFDDGVWSVVWDWHLYAMIIVSAMAFWLQQAALQTGALAAAIATSMAFDPLSSIPLGIVLFEEELHDSVVGSIVSLLALGIVLFGLVLLARAKGRAEGTTGVVPEPTPTPA